MVGGAFVFQHIEQDSLLEHAVKAENVTKWTISRFNEKIKKKFIFSFSDNPELHAAYLGGDHGV